MKLVEVKYFEPQTDKTPARNRYVNCWLELPKEKQPDAIQLRMSGGEGQFAFVDGVCDKFLGYYRAQVVGEISRDRHMEPDRFETVAATK